MTNYTPGQGSSYVRNEAYWENGLPYLDGIEIKIWQDPSGELTALQSGASDLMALTPYDALDDIRKNPNLQVQTSRSASYDAMHMRVDTPPFDNPKVRQALALALESAGRAEHRPGAGWRRAGERPARRRRCSATTSTSP